MLNEIKTIDDVYSELKNNKVQFSSIYGYASSKTKNKIVNMQLGRILINLILPADFRLIDEPVTKPVLTAITNELFEKYPSTISAKTLSDLNREMFRCATINPVSFDIESFIVPDFILKKKKEILNENLAPDDFMKKVGELGVELIAYYEKASPGFFNIIASKAKVSPQDVALFLISKGPVINIKQELSKPIVNCMNDGFTIDEFYKSAAQARGMYLVRSSGTAAPGALARECTFSMANIQFESGTDCKTTQYLELLIDDKLIHRLKGRYFWNDKTASLELIDKAKDIIGKTIKLRSPIYCKQPNGNICNKCYGELANKLNMTNVGIMCGTVINDLSVSSYMSARHKTSHVNMSPTNFPKDLIRI